MVDICGQCGKYTPCTSKDGFCEKFGVTVPHGASSCAWNEENQTTIRTREVEA